MAAISIEPVKPDEVSALAEIGRRTFEQAFASGNDAAYLADYLDDAFSPDRLSRELRNPESKFFFARVDRQIVGYLKINVGEAQTEKVPGETLEIERIYVDSASQGAGVGKALFECALEEAWTIAAKVIWLGVWEDNPKAIEFYARQGFEAFGEHSFRIGNDVQRDVLMRRKV